VILDFIKDVTMLAIIVAALYFTLGAYVRHKKPTWSEPLARRRSVILLVLIFAATGAKVTEDALGGESGPIDEAILLFIHAHVQSTLTVERVIKEFCSRS